MKNITLQSLYILCSFLSGFSIMVVELISSRIVAPVIGASVYTWTSVIGLTLLGLAIGGWWGGKIADKNTNTLPLSFLISSFFVAIIPLLSEHTNFITSLTNNILELNIIISLYLFFLPAVAIGTIQPLILKKYISSFINIGSKYGELSAAWSIGSVLGVFLTGFLFISNFGTKETLWGISVLLFLLGLLFIRQKSKFLLFFGIGVTTLGLIIFINQDQKKNTLFEKETNYYSIKVVDRKLPSTGDSRILFLDFDANSIESKTPNYSFYTESYPVFSYLKKNIRDILVLGAGAYTLPKHFKHYYKNSNVSVVETDGELINVGNTYFDLEKYNISTEVSDAKNFIKSTPKKYDIIFGDTYNSFISVPWYLLTKEWNDEVRMKLQDNGLYAINFIGSIDGEGSLFTQSVIKTFVLTFPNFYIISFGENTYEPQDIILIGVKGDLSITNDTLIKKLKTILS